MRKACTALLALLMLCWLPMAVLQADPFRLADDVSVEPLENGVWLHTSWKELPGIGRVASNGLLIVGNGQSLLVDTAWTKQQTALLRDWAKEKLRAPIKRVIVTHLHDDRRGGLGALRGVTVYAGAHTVKLAKKQKIRLRAKTLEDGEQIGVTGEVVEYAYPGPGHAPDNGVVWLPSKKLLFGGCLVKAADAVSLGNTADAVMSAWPASINVLKFRYSGVKVVVPGHGRPGDGRLLDHTLKLLVAPSAP